MSRKHIVLIGLAGALALVLAAAAYALFGEFPNDQPIETDGYWPVTLIETVNAFPRVYGYGGSGHGINFFFKGDTGKLNEFLARLAKTEDASFRAIFSPEPGQDRTRKIIFPRPGETDKINRVFSYNWCLIVHDNPFHPILEHGKRVEEAPAAGKGRKRERPKWLLSVFVSVHGDIDLARIELPLAYTASVGGRLAKFVKWHNMRRDEAEGQQPSKRDSRPTSEELIEELIESRSLFGVGNSDGRSCKELLQKLFKSLDSHRSGDKDNAGAE